MDLTPLKQFFVRVFLVQLKTDGKIPWNRTAVTEADADKLARNNIEIIQAQGNDIKPMRDRMYQGYFSETKLGFKQMVQNFEEVSLKEKRWCINVGGWKLQGTFNIQEPRCMVM